MVFRFDVTSLPKNALILSAIASLYSHSESSNTGNGPKSLYTVTSPWDVETALWDVPWISEGGDFSNDPVAVNKQDTVCVWEDFDVTDGLKDIVENESSNNGFLLRFDDYKAGYGVSYHSADYEDPMLRPKLSVTYLFDDDEPPVVTISSPKSDVVWTEGTVHTLTWDVTDNNLIAASILHFSSDNGATWSLIDSVNGFQRTYQWTVPNTISTECLIKIFSHDYDNNFGSDESNQFSIEAASGIGYQSENTSQHVKIKKSNESLLIFVPDAGPKTITFSDLKGRLLSTFRMGSENRWCSIPVSLSNGTYLISVKTKTRTIDRAFVVVK